MSVMSQRETWLRYAARSHTLRYQPLTVFAVDLIVVCASLAIGAWGRQRWGLFPPPRGVGGSVARRAGHRRDLAACHPASWWLHPDAVRRRYRRVPGRQPGDICHGRRGRHRVLPARISLSRGFYFIAFVLGGPALLLARWGLRRLVHKVREFGLLQHNVLLVGELASVEEVGRALSRERKLGYRVIGCLIPGSMRVARPPAGCPCWVGARTSSARSSHREPMWSSS